MDGAVSSSARAAWLRSCARAGLPSGGPPGRVPKAAGSAVLCGPASPGQRRRQSARARAAAHSTLGGSSRAVASSAPEAPAGRAARELQEHTW